MIWFFLARFGSGVSFLVEDLVAKVLSFLFFLTG